MSTVYMVTTGIYSEYCIHGIWMDRTDAQAVIDEYTALGDDQEIGYGDPQIEEIDLYESGSRPSLIELIELRHQRIDAGHDH